MLVTYPFETAASIPKCPTRRSSRQPCRRFAPARLRLSFTVMPQQPSPDSLSVPLFAVLRGIGFGEYKNPHHFELGTLFWSLTRLFGFYERIHDSLALPFRQRPFIEADIESFIIRFRIILNDTAFVIRQLLPKDERGLGGPHGGTHPRNREMSILTLADYLVGMDLNYPEFARVFSSARSWIARSRDVRDNVVHYKSKVLVFDVSPTSFAIVNAAGTELTEKTSEGHIKLLLEPVAGFVIDHLRLLHEFMHAQLAPAVRAYAVRVGLKHEQLAPEERLSCLGVRRFRAEVGGYA